MTRRHSRHRVPLARATYQLAHRPAQTCPYTGITNPDYDWIVRYDPDPESTAQQVTAKNPSSPDDATRSSQ